MSSTCGSRKTSTTNISFDYVSITVSEDLKISKVLSERKPTDGVSLSDMKTFHVSKKVKIAEVEAFLFAAF